MSTKAKIGLGVRIYKHDLTFYYDTSKKSLEGIFHLNLEQADGSIEQLTFQITLSGSLISFEFTSADEPAQFSLRQVAEKIFGDHEGTQLLPDAKLPIARVYFAYQKKKDEDKQKENQESDLILNFKFSTN